MTRHLKHSELLVRDEIVSAPPLPTSLACDDHSFELPSALYVAMAGLFFGFVTILALSSRTHMLVSYGVIAALIGIFFAVPALFVRATPPQSRNRSLAWRDFMNRGIDTATGRSSGRDAAVLILSLPVLILIFGIAVATIEQLVS